MSTDLVRSRSAKLPTNNIRPRLQHHRSFTVIRSSSHQESPLENGSPDSLSRQHTDSGFLDPTPPDRDRSMSLAGGDCPRHSQERLKYYCQLHDELVCADCLAMDSRHQGHRHFRAEDLAEEYRGSLVAQLQPVSEMLENANTALKGMSMRRKEITQNNDSVKEMIHATCDKIQSFVESRKQDLIEEADKSTQQKLKHHDAHQAYLEGIASEISTVVDNVHQASADSPSDVLCHHSKLSEWLLDMTRKFQALPREVFLPLQGANLSFSCNNKIMTACQSFGSISEKEADPKRCFIEESSTRGITVGQEAIVQLLMHDRSGEEFCEHIKGIKVEVVSVKTNTALEATFEKDTSGSNVYLIKFTPEDSSNHEIRVKVGNNPIHNSPCTVPVSSVILGSQIGEIKGLLQPYGLAATESDEIVIVENGKDCVSIYKPDGKSVRSIQGKGSKKFLRPRGVAILKSGQIVISDEDGLKHFTMEGKHITAIGRLGSGPLEFNIPSGMALSPDGKLYVCDTFNQRIQMLNSDLSFHGFFGDSKPPAKLNNPYDVAFNSCGKFYVASYGDDSVKMFSEEGLYLGSITDKGNDCKLKHPISVHVNCNDHVFVGEEKASGISVFDQHGRFMRTIPARLTGPFGICTDSNGQLYVTDRSNRRVQIFQ